MRWLSSMIGSNAWLRAAFDEAAVSGEQPSLICYSAACAGYICAVRSLLSERAMSCILICDLAEPVSEP